MILIESRPKRSVRFPGPQQTPASDISAEVKAFISLLKRIGVTESEILHTAEHPEVIALAIASPQRRQALLSALEKRLPGAKPRHLPAENAIEIPHQSLKIGFIPVDAI
jgi:hypothetical protein